MGTTGKVGVVVLVALLVLAFGWIGLQVMESRNDDKFCQENPNAPSCVDGLKWSFELALDPDVDGSSFPGIPFDTVDAAVGGTTGETQAGDVFFPNVQKRTFRLRVHVDQDLDSTEPLWMEPNALFLDFLHFELLEGPHAKGGPLNEQVFSGRIDFISIGQLKTDNVTWENSVFAMDTEHMRHAIGWQTESGIWRPACSEWTGQIIPDGAGCDPVALGTDQGDGGTSGAIATNGVRFFMVLEDRGPFPHKVNPATAEFSVGFSVGSEGAWTSYTIIVELSKDSTNNT